MRVFRPLLAIILCLFIGSAAALADDPGWTVNPGDFEFDMTVIAVLEINGTASQDNDDKIAAFVGNEVRGVVSGTQLFGRSMFFLTVWSHTSSGETITFKAYDASADVVYDLAQSLPFVVNAVTGSTTNPFELTVAAASGADLTVTKTDGVGTVTAGTTVTYTITVHNAGPAHVNGAAVTDHLPASLSGATWTCTASTGSSCGASSGNGDLNTTANLLAGGTATYIVTAMLSAAASGTLTNTATVAAPFGVTDPNLTNNSATDHSTILRSADLSITKTDGLATVGPGAEITYSIVVTNEGPGIVVGATVTDDLPATLSGVSWACAASFGSECGAVSGTGDIHTTVNLLPHGTTTFMVSGTLSHTASGTLSNTATVAAPTGTSDPNPNNNSSTDHTGITSSHIADLAVKKSVDNPQPLVDETIAFVVEIENKGPAATSAVHVTDILPLGLRNATAQTTQGIYSVHTGVWDVGGLAPGAVARLTVSAEIAVSTSVTNTAFVSTSSHDDDDDTNNSSSVTVSPREQTSFWTSAHPDVSTVPALADLSGFPSKNGAATIFLGSDGGGVYRSTDEGENWFPTSLSGVAVRDMEADISTGSIYVATYGSGLYRLDDFGDSPSSVLSASTPLVGGGLGTDNLWTVVVNNSHPSGSDRDVFVGTDGHGILFNNGGSAWKNVSGDLPSAARSVGTAMIHADGAGSGHDRLYIGTFGRGIWYLDYSQLGAGTPDWKAANGGDGALGFSIVFDIAFNGTTFFAATNNGLFSTTHPTTGIWSPVTALSGKIVRSLLVYTDGGSKYVFAGTDGDYLYRSTDGGMTFEHIVRAGAGTTSWWGLEGSTLLRLWRAGDGTLYAGTQDHGVHVSKDNGATWYQAMPQPIVTVVQDLAFSASGDALFGATYGYGVIRTDDFNPTSGAGNGALGWLRVNNGLRNLHVEAVLSYKVGSVEYVFAGTWQGGIYRSLDSGEHWSFVGLNERIVYDLQVCAANRNVFAATDRGEVARSFDNGITWSEIGAATTAIIALLINPNNCSEIYAGTFGAGIYKSNDGGATWARTGMQSGYAFDFAFDAHGGISGGPRIYVGTATGVKFSDDGGHSWHDFSVGLTVPDTRAILAYKSAGGSTVLLAGTWGGGVFVYDHTARAWVRDGLPSNQPILALALHPSGEVVASTQDGTVYRKTFPHPGGASTVARDQEADASLPTDYALMPNYPNPFNPATNIRFEVPRAEHVRVAVYDVLGRRIDVLVDGTVSAGVHELTFEAEHLQSGLYVYRLETPGRILSRSMLLQK